MSKTMAEVLAEHQFMYHSFNGVTQKRYLACSCGRMPLAGDHPTHLADALSDAGFGLVTDAKAEGARAAIAYLREGMGPWAEPRVLGFLEGAHSVAAHIVEDS